MLSTQAQSKMLSPTNLTKLSHLSQAIPELPQNPHACLALYLFQIQLFHNLHNSREQTCLYHASISKTAFSLTIQHILSFSEVFLLRLLHLPSFQPQKPAC